MADVQPEPLAQPELFEPEHVSMQEARLQFGLPERVYAERWKLLNKRSLSTGCTYLEHILTPTGRYPGPVSARDAAVAASVIQWLGTNCGGAFLRETERLITEAQEREDKVKAAEWALKVADWNQEAQARLVFPLRFYRPPDPKTRLIEIEP